MINLNRDAYERTIERLRKIAAGGAAICGVSTFLSANGFGTGWMVIAFGIGFFCFLALAVVLVFEYLIRFLFFRPERKMRWYQFSLAELLMAMTCVAAVCAWLKIFGSSGIGWLVLLVVVISAVIETWFAKER